MNKKKGDDEGQKEFLFFLRILRKRLEIIKPLFLSLQFIASPFS
jgi:hypothetical protein